MLPWRRNKGAELVKSLGSKITKSAAGYRPAATLMTLTKEKACLSCRNFCHPFLTELHAEPQSAGTCRLVKGSINKKNYCNLWRGVEA